MSAQEWVNNSREAADKTKWSEDYLATVPRHNKT